MTTYATMRAAIADELANDGALTTAQINNAIQRAIANYERRPFWFNQKEASFSSVAAQEYYTSADLADIPSIVEILSATISIDGYRRPLNGVNFTDLDREQSGSDTGDPTAFTYFESKIRLFPIPNSVRTIKLAYTYRLAALSADSDTNAWTVTAEELIRNAAKRRIALEVLHVEDLAARCGVLEGEALSALMAENRRRLPQKRLSVPRILGPSGFDITAG